MPDYITYLFYDRNRIPCDVIAWRMLIILLFLMFNAAAVYPQSGNSFIPTAIKYNPENDGADYHDLPDEYEEILITFNVQRVGSLEIPAIVYGKTVYLSVKDIFDFLQIRNIPTADFDSVAGFFINPRATYLIDKSNNKIIYQDKIFILKPNDLIKTPTTLYLNSGYFGQVFGLDCVFDFRSLTVNLNTKIELPAIREMQLQLMRRNLSQLRGEKKADTVIRRSFPLFHLGTADWLVGSTQETKSKSNTTARFGLGAIIAGGELNLSLNYNSDEKMNARQQFYQWKYVNNDHASLRQVTAGKIFAQSVSSLYAPVTGIQFTNTPTTYRRSFGTYTLSNSTEPGWTVELYVNNILVNYTKADASGFYTFEVPMVYGNSLVKLRFYGPWGEERTSEKYMSIPFNFIPFRKLEYNLTAGVVDDDQKGLYARAVLNYGLSRRITIGGGMEYLSTVIPGKFMPFINASLSLGQHILVSGEHTYGVRSKGVINYRTASNLQIDLNYIRYDKDQTAVRFNYLDEKRIVISKPFQAKKFTAFSRFTLNQFTLPYNPIIPKSKIKYTSVEFLVSSVVAGISSNFTTYTLINNSGNPLAYSSLSLTFRLPAGIRFTPLAKYEYSQKKISMLKTELEKNIFNRGYLNVAYEKVFTNDNTSSLSDNVSAITIGLRYNFSFAQTFFAARKSGNTIATTQSARGSMMYDGKTNYLGVNNQTSVGKGGIVILPFLDLNCNGLHDQGEPKAFGLNLRINGGRMERKDHDTTILITGLESYINYFIELDKNSFDNVAWQIRKQTISVTVEPNNFKLIEVPVAVAGEVSGTVSFKENKEEKGLANIIVSIYNEQSVIVAKMLTESDGFFSFTGLAPGLYTARVDAIQLAKLNMAASPVLSFKIVQKTDGDIVDDLRFVLMNSTKKID